MSDISVVRVLANLAAAFMRDPANDTVVLRGRRQVVGIQQAVEHVVSTQYSLSPALHNFPLWYGRYIELTDSVVGRVSVWAEQVYRGGADYHDRFANFVRVYTAAAVEHLLETGSDYADLHEIDQHRHADREKLLALADAAG